MIMAPVASTKPAAGVITTRPATAPEQKPRTEGLPFMMYSAMAHTNAAAAAARVVVMKALAAMPSAATALPALKPYQPTHNMPVPIMVSTMLCGRKAWRPKPVRLPRIRHSTRADQPEVMCTTVPPAKSMALLVAPAFQTPFMKPSAPHTMWANGKYTPNIHSRMNSMMDEYFIRSAMAPTIRAGVMMANISWYIANTLWDTQ